MEKSEQIDLLTKALVQFKTQCPAIDLNSQVKVETKTGKSYTFDYADLPHVKSICDPLLSANGLVVSQILIGNLEIYTMLLHESGQYIAGSVNVGSSAGKSAQENGSLITYFKRYAYCAIIGVVADKDDDANAHDGNSINNKLEKRIIDAIARCGTKEELEGVWISNKQLHSNNEFKKLVVEKKDLL